jgi:hypothetical protein
LKGGHERTAADFLVALVASRMADPPGAIRLIRFSTTLV